MKLFLVYEKIIGNNLNIFIGFYAEVQDSLNNQVTPVIKYFYIVARLD